MSITIRPYQNEDRASLARTIDDVCAEGMMATPGFQPTPEWHHALDTPACKDHLLLLAVREREAIGWCRLFAGLCNVGASYVELGIGVAREWRRRRIGTELVDNALKWAVRRGFDGVRLATREDNEPAIRLFAASGFQTVDREAGELGMRLSLFQSRLAQGEEW